MPGAAAGEMQRKSAADAVYELLHARILALDLPPGARLSEAEVAAEAGVSRQPVRDAFYRLARQGFLVIRPQVATMVSPISARQVLQARFTRTALELEVVREACRLLGPADHAALAALIEAQATALTDPARFHALDDGFHRELAERAGHGHVWELIRETKAHMDRVRFLTLGWSAASALAEHRAILAALNARDTPAAEAAMRQHLSRIVDLVEALRRERESLFGEEDG
jgi:DNA-binding GntR family transcriptional regulator